MKIVGLIVEYNPFHNGHLYHIEESLRITGADKAIVVMSGDFVQRGTPAIMPKHIRSEIALACGASLVIELPLRYATGSAEFFAMGAISLLHDLGCVDTICFGSECGDITTLSEIADILIEEPKDYTIALQEGLKRGMTFPLARQKALELYRMSNTASAQEFTALSDPNNILGVEYMKALKKLKSPMKAFTIQRKTSHYHDEDLQDNHSSASAIRKEIKTAQNISDELISQVPSICHESMKKQYLRRFPIFADDFSLLLHSKLLGETKDSLMKYQDMTQELANRIMKQRNNFLSTEQFTELINSKHMTHTRINRILLHVLLNIHSYTPGMQSIDASHIAPEETSGWHSYIRILGFRKADDEILRRLKEGSALPLLTKLSNTDSLNNQGQVMIQEDIYASNLYESVITHKYQTTFIHELEKSLVFV